MSKIYYLFRHARATGSNSGYGNRIVSATILPEGVAPIKRMAEYFKSAGPSVNFCSEFIRCRQTAAIITEVTHKQFIFDPRLNEYYRKTFAEFVKRVRSFMQFLGSVDQDTIVICTHGMVIAAFKHFFINATFAESQGQDYPDTGVLWIMQGKKIESVNFNSGN